MDIQINNSHNNEEEEDLQDKIRIQAELQDLLTENLNEFKYDDGESTVNSSTNISIASISVNDLHEKYTEKFQNGVTPDEQLKVLYEVRMRELTALRNEYDGFKEEKNKEVHSLKNQLILFEAEIRQLQISKKNCDDLLLEKTEIINNLKSQLEQKDEVIINLRKTLGECETDLNAYRTEVTELQLKLQTEYGPFNLNAKYNSQELHKSLQEKINHLENSLEEEIKKAILYEKEKGMLKEEVNLLTLEREELRNDNVAVIRNFDQAQQQCKDLIDVIEMAKRENDHLKALLEQQESYSNFDCSKSEPMDPVILMNHNEKLRKMLLGKSMEIDTLKTKLKYFEDDLKDLLIYRQLQNDVYKKDFQTCNNASHTKDLLLMQNDLQNYRRTIDDKNQQILNLNSINRDLQEKIEDMILQTRNEIQNISHKYSLPQLQEMTEELERAEATIKELSEKLEKSEGRRQSLVLKMKSNEGISTEELEFYETRLKESKTLLETEKENNSIITLELETCKAEIEKLKELLHHHKKSPKSNKKSPSKSDKSLKQEYDQLKVQLTQVMQHLEQTKQMPSPELVENVKSGMDTFLSELRGDSLEKGMLESKIIEWKKLLNQIKDDEHLKQQFKEAVMNLHESEEKLRGSEETIQELKNSITILEGQQCTLGSELNKYQKDSDEYRKRCYELERQIEGLQKSIESKDEEINNLRSGQENIELLNNKIEAMKKQITSQESSLNLGEQSKQELNSLLQKMNTELEKLRSENLKLQIELKEANAKMMKKNLEKELKNAENDLERSRVDESLSESDLFKKHLQTEMVKAELKLRDELQLEYQKRISEIEKRYQESCKDTNALCKQQTEQLQQQEKKYKEYLKMIMTECAEQVKLLENQKMEAVEQLKIWKEEFLKYKHKIKANDEKCKGMLKKMENESNKKINEWKNWSKHMVSSCLGIDELNKNVRDKVLTDMKSYDDEVAKIEKMYNDKIKRKVKSLSQI